MEHTIVSVVIPVRNAETVIGRCLEAVFSQSYKPEEVIIVDGHSNDGTVESASKYPVRIVYETYGTVGGARQTGLEAANSEYIAFTDADCIPERNWLENLVKGFTEDSVGLGGSVKNIGEGIWGKSIALIADTFLGSGNSVQGRVFKSKCVVRSISGCNSIYRTKDLHEIGGFNVKLTTNEETDLNKRLSERGKLWYTPDAMILHDQNRSPKEFAKRMYEFGYGRGQLRLWALQCIPPLIALLLIASLLFTPWILIIGVILYVGILTLTGVKIAFSENNFRYAFSIPFVYFIEHLFYSVGFWRGLLTLSKNEAIN